MPAVKRSQRQKKKAPKGGSASARRRFGLRIAAFGLGLVGLAFLYGAYNAGHGETVAGWAADAADAALATAGIQVQEVTITGRKYTDSAAVLAALGVSRGSSMAGFDAARARERLLTLDWVRSASVMRLYPDTIHVTIQEYAPFALWRHDGSVSIVDERGAVVSGLDVTAFNRLPLVEGPGAGPAAPEFLPVLRRRPALFARTVSARRIGERRWNLELDNGVEVLLPEEGADVAIDELLRLHERTGLLSRDVRKIDMRLSDRITVLPRERAEASGEEERLAGGDT